MKKIILVSFVTLSMLLFGCSPQENLNKSLNPNTSAPTISEDYSLNESLITDLIKENVEYTNNENLEGYLGTMEIAKADFVNAKTQIEKIFNQVDYDINLLHIEFVAINEKTATAKVQQQSTITKASDNSTVLQNADITYHFVKKEDGWKFKSMEVTNSEVLEQDS